MQNINFPQNAISCGILKVRPVFLLDADSIKHHPTSMNGKTALRFCKVRWKEVSCLALKNVQEQNVNSFNINCLTHIWLK